MQHKEKKTKHTVLCHSESSQITLAAPRLGAEEGVGRTTKNTNTKNLQSRASVEWPDYPDHGPALSGGVGSTKKKSIKQKGLPRVSTERGGSVGQEKKSKEPSFPAQPHNRRPKP